MCASESLHEKLDLLTFTHEQIWCKRGANVWKHGKCHIYSHIYNPYVFKWSKYGIYHVCHTFAPHLHHICSWVNVSKSSFSCSECSLCVHVCYVIITVIVVTVVLWNKWNEIKKMVHRRRFLQIYSLKFGDIWQNFYFCHILYNDVTGSLDLEFHYFSLHQEIYYFSIILLLIFLRLGISGFDLASLCIA